jgi:RNA polymerase sigma factor (sigma-70 family)
MEDQFLEIITKNRDAIYRLCVIYASSSTLAEDIFQDVLLQIWKALPSFQQKSAVNTWVYRIALNVCMRSKCNSEKARTLPLDTATQWLNGLALPEHDHEATKSLYRCIAKLEGVNRGIIALYLEDLSYREIAGITGLTENHVAVRVKRIKAILSNCIKTEL